MFGTKVVVQTILLSPKTNMSGLEIVNIGLTIFDISFAPHIITKKRRYSDLYKSIFEIDYFKEVHMLLIG